nr:MAG TPA: hypothetical protein [Caudoviricetes sp.]DAT35525.1 MAG TPA: hypothetical protein [Caudoviricetes sp.]
MLWIIQLSLLHSLSLISLSAASNFLQFSFSSSAS